MSDDGVRAIVREEIARALRVLAEAARGSNNDYGVGDLESAGMSAVEDAAVRAVELLPHAGGCAKRDQRWFMSCTCGVSND